MKCGLKIAIIGDVGLDVYRHGVAPRLCPEAPVPIFLQEKIDRVPGLAANVAQNVQTLGASAELIMVAGIQHESLFESLKIDLVSYIEDHLRPSTIKTRFMVGNHFLLRHDEETTAAISEETEDRYIKQVKERIRSQRFSALVVSDYAKGVLTKNVCEEIIPFASKLMPVIVDPKPRADFKKYSHATLLTPNSKETEELKALSRHESLDELCETLKLKAMVLTRGEKGILAYDHSKKEEHHIHALQKKVYDVCGAGDTVVAALAVCLAGGDSLERSAEVANVAASIVVGKLGTATVSKEELLQELS
jgi:rfaE bifunctional protein kinase chain/domain